MKSEKTYFQYSCVQTPRAGGRGTNDTDEKTALQLVPSALLITNFETFYAAV